MLIKSHPRLTGLFMTLLGLFLGNFSATAQIEALATCDGVTTDDTYYIEITNIPGSPTDSSIIIVSGIPDTVVGSSYTSGPFSYVDGTQTISVDVTPFSTLVTESFDVHEVLCTDVDGDGNFDFSTDICDYTKHIDSNGVIIATVAPYEGSNVYLYILTGDDSLFISSTTPSNYSGLFENLPDGSYTMWAFNFLNTTDASTFLGAIPNATNMYTYSAAAPACYALCGDATYTIDCGSIVDIYVDPSDAMVCADEDVEFYVQDSFLITPPAGTSLSYQWQVSTDDGVTWGDTSDVSAPDSVLSLSGVTVADSGKQFRVIVTMTVAATTISMDTSGVGTLSVYGIPEIASGLSVTVNSGDNTGITLTEAVGSIDIDSFNFISVDIGGLTAGSNATIPNTTVDTNYIFGDSYTNDTGMPDTAFYMIAPISGSGCVGDTITVYVEVLPCPELTDPAVLVVCSDDVTGLMLPAMDDNGLTIDSFMVSATVGTLTGTPTEGTIYALDSLSLDSFANVTDLVDTVKYTIVAYANGCASNVVTAKVAVHPEPVYDDVAAFDVCSDEAIAENIPFLDDSGLSIDSVYIVAVIGDSLTGIATTDTMVSTTAAISGDVFTNTSNGVDSVVYTITPYKDDCAGDSFTMTFRIVPEPVGSDPLAEVCSDELISIDLSTLITNGSTGLSFEWYALSNANVEGEDTTLQTTATLSDQISNTTSGSEIVTYKVIPQMGTCIGDTFDVTVTVYPEAIFSDTSLMVCSDELVDVDLASMLENGISLQGFTYVITSSDSAAVSPATNRTDTTLANISDTYTNTSSADVLITYTVTPYTNDDCAGDPFDVDVTIKPEPLFDDMTLTVCSGDTWSVSLADSLINTGVGILGYNYTVSSGNQTEVPAGSARTDTSNASVSDLYTNTTSSSVDVTYTITPYSVDTCEGDVFTLIVTVDPEAVVDAGSDTTICSTGVVDISNIGASITGGASGGTWSTNGAGSFDSNSFASATEYTPHADDIAAGSVTLTLTSDATAGSCPQESDTVVITILDITCSTFPWDGND